MLRFQDLAIFMVTTDGQTDRQITPAHVHGVITSGLFIPHSSLGEVVYSKEILNKAGYPLCLMYHLAQCAFVLASIRQ